MLEGDDDLVKFLVENGANVSLLDFQDFTALHYAAEKGFSHICKVLIEDGGADVNYHAENKETPLHRAVYFGHKKTVKMLLAHGAVDIASGLNYTPVHKAVKAQVGNCKIMNIVLSSDAV